MKETYRNSLLNKQSKNNRIVNIYLTNQKNEKWRCPYISSLDFTDDEKWNKNPRIGLE